MLVRMSAHKPLRLAQGLALSFALAFVACGGSSSSSTRTGPAPETAAQASSRSSGARSEQVANDTTGQGVSLQNGGTYEQRFDPSGWSGTSTPPGAIGGGPNGENAGNDRATPPVRSSSSLADTPSVGDREAQEPAGAAPVPSSKVPSAPLPPASPAPAPNASATPKAPLGAPPSPATKAPATPAKPDQIPPNELQY